MKVFRIIKLYQADLSLRKVQAINALVAATNDWQKDKEVKVDRIEWSEVDFGDGDKAYLVDIWYTNSPSSTEG